MTTPSVPLTTGGSGIISHSGLNSAAQTALVNAAGNSPYLAGELNAFASNNSKDGIVVGTAGKGTFTTQNPDGSMTITIDPNMWTPSQPNTFATVVAHELGHADLTDGMPLATSNPTLAQTYGSTAEGEAVTSEYIVATQLGMPTMHSDPNGNQIMPTLSADANALGVNVSQLTFSPLTDNTSTSLTYTAGASVTQAGTWYGTTQVPSVVSINSGINYNLYWQDSAVLNGCGINPQSVDWSQLTSASIPYTSNAALQQCTVTSLTLPYLPAGGSTVDGSAKINGTYSYTGIPVSLTETVNDGSIQYTQVGTSNSAGQVTETITGTGDVLNLSGTSSLFDTINIGSGTSTAADTTTVNGSYLNVTGGNYNVLTGSGSWDNFTVGGVSTLTASGSVMNLHGASYDTVNDNVGNSTIALSGYGAINTNASNINISASGVSTANSDTINIGGNSDTVGISGNYLTATTTGTGNSVTESGIWDKTTIGAASNLTMSGGFDTLYGTNDYLTSNAANSTIVAGINSVVAATGAGDVFNDSSVTLGSTTFYMDGANETLKASGVSGHNIAVNISSPNSVETINGNYITAKAASTSTGDTITEYGTWDNTTIAADSGLTMGNGLDLLVGTHNDTLTCNAGYSTIDAGSNSLVVANIYGNAINGGTGSTFDMNAGGQTLNASGTSSHRDDVNLGSNISDAINGSYDTLKAGSGDTLNISGQFDEADAINCTVDYSGNNTGDVVFGSGDSGTGWAGYVAGGYYGGGGGGYYYYGGGGYAAVKGGTTKSTGGIAQIAAFDRTADASSQTISLPAGGDMAALQSTAALYNYSQLMLMAGSADGGGGPQVTDLPLTNYPPLQNTQTLAMSLPH